MPVYCAPLLSTQYPRSNKNLTHAHHHGQRCEYNIVDYLKDPTCCCYCGHRPSQESRTWPHEMERHMCSRHSVNIEDHFAQRDNVCDAVLRVQDDDSTLVVCGYSSTARNDLERHKESHVKDNFWVKSVDSVKTPRHKIHYVKPEDRVAAPTREDKPAVCPQFDIHPYFLKEALPPCFWPSAEYWEEKRKRPWPRPHQ
ncbi:hypothetical protein NLI96_g11637 [Meripilus lineatus]|uniref:Uncharacterized protein n=1 Tax=Meripilus lineatus TaxID=2056292 RepID=A0AAD5YD74_9APHY|nr:hypothetical protein NLI96_g11637 [Physisporinus lineatus]